MNTLAAPQTTTPRMSQDIYDTLLEGLSEFDAAFSGPNRAPLPDSATARAWLKGYWAEQRKVIDAAPIAMRDEI